MALPDSENAENETDRRPFDPAQSAGLFVGISEFKERGLPEVPYAVDDAVDLAHLFVVELGLIAPDRAVLALAGKPRKPESVQRLEELLDRGAAKGEARMPELYQSLSDLGQETGEQGLFLVTVASHGVTDQGGDHVLAANSQANRLVKTGIAVDEVFDEVARAVAPRRLVLLDTCRERLSEGTRGLGGRPMSASFAEAITRARGQAVLSAASHGAYAYDDGEGNGVFSRAVIEGMRGKAEADANGWITVHTLAVFLQDRVSRWVKKNRPAEAVPFAGIGQRGDGPWGQIPLVPHPEATRRRNEYRARWKAAESRLGANLGGVLTGVLIDQILELLPSNEADERAERVLAEIEALDGGERAKRSLRDLVRELRGELFSLGFVTDGLEKKRVPAPTVPPVTEPAAGTALDGPLGMRLRFVPGGTYWIGSPKAEEGRDDDEIRHEVELTRGFWLAETAVTQGQWKALVPNNPSYFKACGDDCPVERVSWWEAATFANLLSEREGLEPCYELVGCTGTLGTNDYQCRSVKFRGFQCTGYRLPSEAEWEVAARAVPAGRDFSTAIYTADGALDLGSIAWYVGTSGSTTHPVGKKLRNGWGFADMLGNVYEWTGDDFARYPAGRVRDPLSQEGTSRVIRGGSWSSPAQSVRAAYRGGIHPSHRGGFLGFRLARGQGAAPG